MNSQEFVNWFEGFSEALKLFGQEVPTKEQWNKVTEKVSTLKTPIIFRGVSDGKL